MLPLDQVPGFPRRAIARLADFSIDTAERFWRNVRREDTRRDLEQILGASELAMATACVKRALGVEDEPDAPPSSAGTRQDDRPAAEPDSPWPPRREPKRPARDDWASQRRELDRWSSGPPEPERPSEKPRGLLDLDPLPEPEPEPEPARSEAPRAREDKARDDKARDDKARDEKARQEWSDSRRTGPAPAKTAATAPEPPPEEADALPEPTASPPGTPVEDQMARLEALRRQVTQASDEKWEEYLQRARQRILPEDVRFDSSSGWEPYKGDYVILTDVDPTHQTAGYDGKDRAVVHPSQRHRFWVIEWDSQLGAMVRLAREVQTELGFGQESRWDVVARFRKVDWNSGTMDKTKEDLPFVRAYAVRLRNQFCVFTHPQKGPIVPGLQAAREEAESIRGAVGMPVGSDPTSLLAAIVQSLALGHLELFGKLWISTVSERDLKYHFRQYQKAYASCEGNIAFDHYDPRENPESYPDCRQVKMFVRRTNTDGTTVCRPLTLVQQGGEWRIYAGTI